MIAGKSSGTKLLLKFSLLIFISFIYCIVILILRFARFNLDNLIKSLWVMLFSADRLILVGINKLVYETAVLNIRQN